MTAVAPEVPARPPLPPNGLSDMDDDVYMGALARAVDVADARTAAGGAA